MRQTQNISRIVLITSIFLSPLISPAKVFFSPNDKITKVLIHHLNQANDRIFVAMYMLTEKRIALALINAHQRGLDVQVVLDPISTTSQFGKAPLMYKQGIPLFCYAPSTKIKGSKGWMAPGLMHNKFAIIDDLLWTGSFNWTRSADQRNRENVIILNEDDITAPFLQEFELLKEQSYSWPPRLYVDDCQEQDNDLDD
jgi:phosphatidylserine/phosphatidylglycerophosphate/cardiolipin synthase-like enzyme